MGNVSISDTGRRCESFKAIIYGTLLSPGQFVEVLLNAPALRGYLPIKDEGAEGIIYIALSSIVKIHVEYDHVRDLIGVTGGSQWV